MEGQKIVINGTTYYVKEGVLYSDIGERAVALSKGFGAGWSTWENVDALDAEFNILFLQEKFDEAKELAETKGFYTGGIEDITVVFIDKDTKFIIREYDGSESIEYKDAKAWL